MIQYNNNILDFQSNKKNVMSSSSNDTNDGDSGTTVITNLVQVWIFIGFSE